MVNKWWTNSWLYSCYDLAIATNTFVNVRGHADFEKCFQLFSVGVYTSTHDLERSSTTHILTFGIPCNGELFFWKTLRCPVPGNPRDPTCRRLFSDTSNHGPSPGWTAVQSENVREVQYVCTFCIQSMYVWKSEYVHAVKYICMYM